MGGSLPAVRGLRAPVTGRVSVHSQAGGDGGAQERAEVDSVHVVQDAVPVPTGKSISISEPDEFLFKVTTYAAESVETATSEEVLVDTAASRESVVDAIATACPVAAQSLFFRLTNT